jgi:hypothetical protein
MAGLTAAHRGYDDQDLLVACRLIDMLLAADVDESARDVRQLTVP